MTRIYAPILSMGAMVFVLAVVARPAAAQVPFFGRGATIFDPEIGVVQSGVVSDVQATVSADQKYVTLTMRATNAQLLSLREFAFQIGNGGAPAGFVGGAGAANGNGNGAAGNGPVENGAAAAGGRSAPGRAPGRAVAQASKAVKSSILDRPGLTQLTPANEHGVRSDVDPRRRLP